MLIPIEPPKNLTFNKESYKFVKSLSKPKEESNKSEKAKDFLSNEYPPERSITPIDDGEEIDVPLIPSNQLGLVKKPSAGTLNNFDCLKYVLHINFNLIL